VLRLEVWWSDIAINYDGIHTRAEIHVYDAPCMAHASAGALKSIVEPGVRSNEL
jgi:hypothetical protein